jgi:hypothetical protein
MRCWFDIALKLIKSPAAHPAGGAFLRLINSILMILLKPAAL